MSITKSSRHQKIIGEFGELLVCNWLSRSGFEVARVDHTGIDIIAYNRTTEQRLGITVKSRTREDRTKYDSVNIFISKKNDRQKLLDACKSFACEPWIAIYIEYEKSSDLYLISLDNYDKNYSSSRPGKVRIIEDWKMGEKDKDKYAKDPNIKHIKSEFDATKWF